MCTHVAKLIYIILHQIHVFIFALFNRKDTCSISMVSGVVAYGKLSHL